MGRFNKTFFGLLLLAGSGYGATTQAQDTGPYAGLQLANLTYAEQGVPDLNPKNVILQVGYFINPNFAIEGRYSLSGSSDSATLFGLTANMEFTKISGIYLKGLLPVSEKVSAYALLGQTNVEAKMTLPQLGLSDTQSENDMSFGVGSALHFNETAALTLEYMSYLDKSDFSLSALSIGMMVRF